MMEKNRNILQKTLRQLSQIKPGEQIWETIEENINRKPLSAKLSQFTPPSSIWESIEEELDIRKSTGNLNSFDPPAYVWQNIESLLGTKTSKKQRRTIGLWAGWSIAAAAVLFIGLMIYQPLNNFDKGITYSEEWIEKRDFQEWTSDDELLEQTIFLICQENPGVCQTTEFKKMEDELDFLARTKENIINQMNPYEQDGKMVLILTKIELERTDIINQMVALID